MDVAIAGLRTLVQRDPACILPRARRGAADPADLQAPGVIGFVHHQAVALLLTAAYRAVWAWCRDDPAAQPIDYRPSALWRGLAERGAIVSESRGWGDGIARVRRGPRSYWAALVEPAFLGVELTAEGEVRVPARDRHVPPSEGQGDGHTGRAERPSRRHAPGSSPRSARLSGVEPPALPIDGRGRRMIEALRLIGRLEFAVEHFLRRTTHAGLSYDTLMTDLRYLEREGLIGSVRDIPLRYPRDYPVIEAAQPIPDTYPKVVFLTEAGRAFLRDEVRDIEVDERTYERVLRARAADRRPSKITTPHDLGAAWWVVYMVRELMWNRFCTRVFVQMEYTTIGGAFGQRIDAVLVARFSKRFPRQRGEIGRSIPWHDGMDRREDEDEIRLSLEWDRDTEHGLMIAAKGATYGALTYNNTYGKLLGGPVVPVFIAPSVERARKIERELSIGWPGGIAAIGTVRSARHALYGPLWGKYSALSPDTMMAHHPPDVVFYPLLTGLEVNAEHDIYFKPLFTLEEWLRGRVTPPDEAGA